MYLEFGDEALATILLVKPNPGIGVICFRIGAGGIEHAFDRICCVRDIAGAFETRKRWGDQHHQYRNDADDDEKFEERESATRFYM